MQNGTDWYFYNGTYGVRLRWKSGVKDKDNYLFSPAMKLQAGMNYHLTMLVRFSSSTRPAACEIAVLAGKGNTPEAMTDTICPLIDNYFGTTQTYIEYDYVPTTSGVYNFCLWGGNVKGNTQYLDIKEFKLSAPQSPNTPQPCSDLAYTVEKDLHDATFTFKAPTINLNKQAGTGNLTYHVLVDNVEKAMGTCAYGATVTSELKGLADGQRTLSVYVNNADGIGNTSQIVTRWIGQTTPNMTDVRGAFNDNKTKINLDWDRVTTNNRTSTQGYCDYDSIIYTVRLQRTGEVLYQGMDNHYTFDVPQSEDFATYMFGVDATYHKTSSQKYTTGFGLGSWSMPVRRSFSGDGYDLAGWNIVDGNGDGEMWASTREGAQIRWSDNGEHNDWLISPMINIKGGAKVRIQFSAWGYNAAYPEKLQVLMGTSQRPEDQTIVLTDTLTFLGNAHQQFSIDTVLPGGQYTVAFHALSPYDTYYLTVNDLVVSYIAPEQSTEEGVENVPYSEGWNTAADFNRWKVVNGGTAASTWSFSSGSAFMNSYNYNKNRPEDDWLISPPVFLAAGRPYFVNLQGYEYFEGYDRAMPIEIKVGRDTAVSSMVYEAMPFSRVFSRAWSDYPEGMFVPDSTAIYYFGIHAYDNNAEYPHWYTYIDNFSVSYKPMETLPGTPTAAAFNQTGWTGKLTFTMPATTVSRQALEGKLSVKILRDGAMWALLNNLAPGQSVELPDQATQTGEHTYKIIPFTTEGEGLAATVEGFMGVKIANDITDLKVAADPEDDSKVLVEWKAPATDVDGTELTANDLTYNIVDAAGQGVMVGLTGTSAVIEVPADTASILTLGVQAITASGASNTVMAEPVSCGKPYTLPYRESFLAYASNHGDKVLSVVAPDWTFQYAAGNSFIGAFSQDEGHGLLWGKVSKIADGYMQTGKIDLTGIEKPGFTFWTTQIKADNINVVGLQVNDGTGWKTVASDIAINTLTAVDGWCRVICNLSAYKGKVVTLRITFGARKYINMFFDNMQVVALDDNDLEAGTFEAPANAKINTKAPMTLRVTNNGIQAARNTKYKVALYVDDQLRQGAAGVTLKCGASNVFTFEPKFTVFEQGTHKIYAKILFDDDDRMANNTSDTLSIDVKEVTYPQVTLTGNSTDNAVELNWTAPVLADNPMDMAEGFEEGNYADVTYLPWQFVDKDRKAFAGFSGITVPGIVTGQTLGSYMVWTNDGILSQLGITAHGGNNVLATFGCYDGGKSSDWLISPTLTGEKQTIKFFLASNPSYEEKVVCYYSKTGKKVTDFTQVGDTIVLKDQAKGSWHEQTFEVPDSAKYFAIEHASTGSFWMLIDDITYRGVNPDSELSLSTYKVYRDDERIASLTPDKLAFTDDDVCDKHVYTVTPLYNMGEGQLSNPYAAAIYPAVTINGAVENGMVVLTWEPVKYKNGNEMPVESYDVYRDGTKLNGQPVMVGEYRDPNMTLDQAHTYTVVARYATGTSRPSNEFVATVSGLGDIYSQSAVEVARYDELGRRVDVEAQGWVLIRYSDGTTAKKLMK